MAEMSFESLLAEAIQRVRAQSIEVTAEDMDKSADEMIASGELDKVVIGRIGKIVLAERNAEADERAKAEWDTHSLNSLELRFLGACVDLAGAYIYSKYGQAYGAVLSPTLVRIGDVMEKVNHLADDGATMAQSPF